MTFDSVLIANRGEIARRIIRACRASGLRSIAVYSDADAGAPFVGEADDAVHLGPTPAAESYLAVDRLLAAAKASGAQAIHPGYGFLSERADFARAVADAGLVFIGPSPDVIELMGRKDRAREVAERAGVPVTPRFEVDAVPAEAYPVLVKAAAGGGGKGMHVVREAAELADAVATARREAAAAFGDDTLLIETYVEGGRHVEVQVFGDEHGNVVHLYDRDCSAQRRHQKVVEEAPAPGLDPEVRRTLLESSVALCREVGYTNAGTVEFLVAGDRAYFLEMNTRLQVEHPVTEEVTGVDLVAWQLAVAAGEALPLAQDEITCTGHAIEARVYAEDPYAGFLPQAGRIDHVQWSPFHRVDSAIDDPGEVTTAYDPMLAKIIATGDDRDDAISRLAHAVDFSSVIGIATNLGFVRRLVCSTAFAAGEVHTGWLDGPEAEELLTRPSVPAEALGRAATLLAGTSGADQASPWAADGWRGVGALAEVRTPLVDQDGVEHWVRGVPAQDDDWARVGSDGVAISVEGQVWTIRRADAMRRATTYEASGSLASPMPGTVIAIDVAVGDRVEAGQRVGAVEAMKMELALTSPHAGVVTAIGATVGQTVPMGHVVVTVEEE